MAEPIQGVIVAVATSLQGAVAAGAWSSASGGVPVVNSGDLVRDGGLLQLPSGQVAVYTGVVETNDPDGFDLVLFSTDPGVGAEDWMQVSPPASESWADVQTLAGDTIRAAVPHALKPLILDGTRDPDTAEHVEVDMVGTQLQIVNVVAAVPVFTGQDVLDLSAQLAADQAARDAQLAQLNSDLQTEASTRAQAITTLNTNLGTEQSARTQAITTLQQSLADEATARQGGLQQLNSDLGAERQARSDADTQISKSVQSIPVVSYGTTAPSTPRSGDVWFTVDAGGNATGAQRWSGSAWVAQPWAGSALAAGTITAGQLAAGAVTADKIGANAVTADKLLVGSTENLFRDGELVDPVLAHNWPTVAASCTRVVDAVRGPVLRFTTATKGSAATYNANTCTVVAGDSIYYEFTAWTDGTAQSNNSIGVAYFVTKADGSTSYLLGTMTTAPNGGKYTGLITVSDSTWRTIQLRAYCTTGTAGGGQTFDIGRLYARRRNTGQVLVDGTVTATQLAAGAVTADKIGAGAVTANAITADAITADKIKAGAVGADEIAAGSVTTAALSAGAVTTDVLAAGAVTADKITTDAVTADKIKAGAVGADEIAANAITSDKISANAITAAHITAGAIGATQLAVGAVTAAAIKAGAIDGMTISGADIYSPSATAHPRAHLGSSKLEVIRADGDGVEFQSMSLGGSDADQLMLFDTTGTPLAGFDPTGNGLAQDLDVSGDFTVGGQDLFDDILAPYPLGILAHQIITLSDVPAAGSGEIGTYELAFNARKGRAYRIVVESNISCTTANTQVTLRLRGAVGSTVENAPTPTTSTTQIGSATVSLGSTTAGQRVRFEHPYVALYSGPYGVRVLLTYQNATGNYSTQLRGTSTAPGMFYVEDVGALPSGGMGDAQKNSGGGTPFSGTAAAAPTAQRKTYTSTWNAAWSKSWQGSTVRSDVLGQGYYGGTQWYSMIGWTAANSTGGETGKTIAAACSGASISKVEVKLVDKSWYYGVGGKAKIGHHAAAAAPSSPQTSGGAAVDSPQWTKGATKWVTLPSTWYSDIAKAAITGITLGEGAGSDQTYYGKFSPAAGDCQIRITYTK